MSELLLSRAPLRAIPWPTRDPFLFCAHHDDRYPAGEATLGPPRAALAGRQIGMDFSGKDGWSMYHGAQVPGFPQHPHRGFETVTLARAGFIDHSDSLGAAARFGDGDVQWMTAGRGVVHSEMFPLLASERDNPTELFQVWLNLPAERKLAEPRFAMLWSEQIPRVTLDGGAEVVVAAGQLGDAVAPAPPPDSWAADPENDVAIWTIRLPAGASGTLPAARPQSTRTLYYFVGDAPQPVAGAGASEVLSPRSLAEVRPDVALELGVADEPRELLVLQGKPIGEPVAQYGPFVMNSAREIEQAMLDYRRTQFGGWPWPSDDPVHPRDRGRFAHHADGRDEEPTSAQ